MSSKIISFYPIFNDIDGTPLESGYIYIGTTGLNPLTESNRLDVFWDESLTIPAAQPIRTIGGYPSNNGKRSALYISEAQYSLLVLNKNLVLVQSDLSITDPESSLRNDLSNTSDISKGAALVGQSIQVVTSKATAKTITPVATRKLWMDGTTWTAATGASPGTYSDDASSPAYGMVIIPTGGDGSAAWIRDADTALGYPVINGEWFGLVAGDDGTTDRTTQITEWLAALDSGNFESTIDGYGVGFLPEGKHQHTSTLTIKGGTKVIGVPRRSVFLPNFANDVAVIQQTGSTLEDVVISGANTTGESSGLDIGRSELFATNGYTRRVYVVGFATTNSQGLDFGAVTYWHFEECWFTDNYDGAFIYESGSTTSPSLVTFEKCEFKSNERYGMDCQGGSNIAFRSCNYELNNDLGARVVAGAGAEPSQITFDNCWFEANQWALTSGPARNAAYQCLVAGRGVKFNDAHFFGNTNEAKAINLNNAVDFVVDNCEFPLQDGTVLVDGTSNGHFKNWPSTNGEFGDRVTDTAGASYLDDTTFGTFTPALTFATPGDLSVVYSNQIGRWDRNGRRVTLQIFLLTSTFTHSTASGNLRLTGIPFNSANEADAINIGALVWGGITKASYTDINARILSNSSFIDFMASGSGQTQANVTAADCPTAGTMYLNLTISYEIPN